MNIPPSLERLVADMDFVPREEFEAVKAMAQKAREENERLEARLDQLLAWKNPNPILAKIIASVQRLHPHILTFVLLPNCPSHNNYGEYIIRKGVLKRKISGGSMSAKGAHAYAILISIAQTCHLRKISFPDFLLASLRHYCSTGKPLLLSQYAAIADKSKAA